MRKEIHVYFSALGLRPGATAAEIRRSYLQLVQRWHPDHFKSGSYMHTTAEDLTKELNEAYEQLYKKQLYKKFLSKVAPKRSAPEPARSPADQAREAYDTKRRQNDPGPVPPVSPKPERPVRRAPRPVAPDPSPPPAPVFPDPPEARRPKRTRYPRANPASPPAKPAATRKEAGSTRFHNWPWSKIAIAVGLIAAGFAIRQTMPGHYDGYPKPLFFSPNSHRPAELIVPHKATRAKSTTEDRGKTKAVQPPAKQDSPGRPVVENTSRPADLVRSPLARDPEERPADTVRTAEWGKLLDEAKAQMDTFQTGDNKSKVLSIQGAPDEATESIYRYGSSVVYFRDGLVSGWSDGFPRLHVRFRTEMGFDLLNTFSVGSSRSEVFRAQGPPTNLTPQSYYYGASVVNFENDRVTSWLQVDESLSTLVIPVMPEVDLDKSMRR